MYIYIYACIHHVITVYLFIKIPTQVPSGWLIGIPLLDDCNPQYIGFCTYTMGHILSDTMGYPQPTEVLNRYCKKTQSIINLSIMNQLINPIVSYAMVSYPHHVSCFIKPSFPHRTPGDPRAFHRLLQGLAEQRGLGHLGHRHRPQWRKLPVSMGQV